MTAVLIKDLWFTDVWWLRIRSHAALPYIHVLIGLLCVLSKSPSFSVPPTLEWMGVYRVGQWAS